MTFRPKPRACVVCKANLSAVKRPAGWRLPQQVTVNITVDGVAVNPYTGGGRTRTTIHRHFCPGCASSAAIAVDFDRLSEKGIFE